MSAVIYPLNWHRGEVKCFSQCAADDDEALGLSETVGVSDTVLCSQMALSAQPLCPVNPQSVVRPRATGSSRQKHLNSGF